MPITHLFQSAKSDGADATLVRASNWNANHVIRDAITNVSGNYSVLTTDETIKATAGASGITLTLPTAVGVSGQVYKVLRVDSGVGNVLFATTSSQTINGAAASTVLLINQWQYVWLMSDGANWIIINNN
jgi:hypothetical protein